MADSSPASRLDDLVLDLDMVVYAMERPGPTDADALKQERERLRRELERIRTSLQDVQRQL